MHAFSHELIGSFTQSMLHSSIHSLMHPVIQPMIHSCVAVFIDAFIQIWSHTRIHSLFIDSLIYSSTGYQVPDTWYASICIRMHPYTFICIRHASVCTHLPSYAPLTLPNANIQHTCSQTKAMSKKYRNRNDIIVFSTVESIRIQPKMSNSPKINKNKQFQCCWKYKLLYDFAYTDIYI